METVELPFGDFLRNQNRLILFLKRDSTEYWIQSYSIKLQVMYHNRSVNIILPIKCNNPNTLRTL